MLLHLLVEGVEPLSCVAGSCRVEMRDVAVGCGDAELLMLQPAEAAGEQPGADQQNKRECRLEDDERALGQRGAIARRTVDAREGFSGVSL